MASKTRVPNKVLWGLEDILAAGITARDAWKTAYGQAKRQMDPVGLAALGTLRDQLAVIERVAMSARRGEYRE